jgi:hypothetical protein
MKIIELAVFAFAFVVAFYLALITWTKVLDKCEGLERRVVLGILIILTLAVIAAPQYVAQYESHDWQKWMCYGLSAGISLGTLLVWTWRGFCNALSDVDYS